MPLFFSALAIAQILINLYAIRNVSQDIWKKLIYAAALIYGALILNYAIGKSADATLKLNVIYPSIVFTVATIILVQAINLKSTQKISLVPIVIIEILIVVSLTFAYSIRF